MPIRDIAVLLLFLASIPVSFRNPVHGVILYALVSYLSPHRLTWGFAYNLKLAYAIALSTLLGWIFCKGDRELPITREIVLMALLWILASFGWFVAFDPDGFAREWTRFTKILLMIFLTVSLVKTRKHIRLLYLVIALSIGFYSLKGAIWSFRGSAGLVWGPAGSFFEGNNGLGMVINMVWPLFLMMARNEKRKWFRLLFWCLFLVSPITIIRTNSRASALALGVTSMFLFMRVKRKILFILLGCVVFLALVPFVPSHWYSRMETIKTYEADGSAMGRINAWYAAWNMAVDRPLTGGGLNAFTPETISKYAPDPEDFHDVHSIYFEVLGEMGFPGLFVFLSLIVFTMMKLMSIITSSRDIPDGEFFANYADGTFLGLIGYMVNGAFLGLAYFDLLYQYVGLAVSLHVVLSRELEASRSQDLGYLQDQVSPPHKSMTAITSPSSSVNKGAT